MSEKWQSITLGILCFLLTVLICIQIKTVKQNGTTVSLSQEESELKTQVLKMKEKYENQYAELERIEKELAKTREKAASNNNELKALEEEIKNYNNILGTTDVKGKGVIIKVQDGVANSATTNANDLLVHDLNVLSIVNELKNAGAEAISINGNRVVNTTAISCDGNVIVVNGEKISSPIEIYAIGLPEQLTTLNRAGGTLERFKELGKQVELNKSSNVQIPKYTGVFNFKYAKTVK